ncbi:copper amine oxidase N-terminal domain-containing protein [Paenibacillus arenilitoris]|uniref:Copper amine oxidase N-terminal domain-containing protein n=1 Tax=Paenibacillus arenilitoris TaxID=2772299 RepID=A0A927CL18_9BACL|nr:copper amine oxidase N-terminal domain-containing protein [Paenibacillus arenilitoris]MBD2869999.1 copper amine oxidase N-terminal domain-containing protein [Paenibacillus arenilitoris]
MNNITKTKRKIRKGIVPLLAAAALTAVLPSATAFGADENALPSVQFQIGNLTAIDHNGPVKLPIAPYIEQGTAMVPVRALADGLDASLNWEPADKSIRLARGELTVHLQIGKDAVAGTYVKNVKLPAKVTAIRGQAFVPAKAVSELLDANTSWNAKEKKVTIQANAEEDGVVTESYSLDRDDEGWQGDFADLPVNFEPSIYELAYARELIPLKDNASNYGLKLSGMNRSDDLFMFAARKIDGLQPNTAYNASLSFSLYTDEEGGMVGVGGAPGEAVSIKAGFAAKAPEVVEQTQGEEAFFALNLDKGNQSTEGADLKIVGNMVKPDNAVEGFQKKRMSHAATLQTNAEGELYVIIGSDSGYEGRTTFYLDDIRITLSPKA